MLNKGSIRKTIRTNFRINTPCGVFARTRMLVMPTKYMFANQECKESAFESKKIKGLSLRAAKKSKRKVPWEIRARKRARVNARHTTDGNIRPSRCC